MTPPDHIPYRRLFPWLHLFRAIGLAFSFRQLLVAAGAVGALWLGGVLFERLVGRSTSFPTTQAKLRTQPQVVTDTSHSATPNVDVGIRLVFNSGMVLDLACPWRDVTLPAIAVVNSSTSVSRRWQAAVECAWCVAVWSLFGLALCRLAARQLARDEEGSFRKAVQFGLTRWRHGVVAPVIPIAAALVLMGVAVLFALPGRIPFVGSFNAVVVSPVILGCSFVATFLAFATILGWPLMVAAIACDDCDGFGGLSRSYSLWTGRPWRFVWCVVVAVAVGCVVMVVAPWLFLASGRAAGFAIERGMGNESAAAWAGATCEFLMTLIITSYAISFFWTSATIIYAVLRQSVDGVPLDVMAPDDDARPARDPLPVVGMPAVSSPEPPASQADEKP
jgi:hypothetical protein